MAVFSDTASDSFELDADLLEPRRGPAAREVAIEREYADFRGAVRSMLRADFPRLRDIEEIYQEAWTELLELEARGEVVRNRRALLKKIAWRRAADVTRNRRAEAVDPTSPAFTLAADTGLTPDEEAELHLDGEALRLLIDSLDPRQAAVLRLRFHEDLPAREIQARLGVSPKRLEKIVTEAYKQVAAYLGSEDAADSPWVRRQRSLLLACEAGIASPSQRRRAQHMVDRDATCRAMLREMRATLHGVAAVLPMPVLGDRPREVPYLDVVLGRLEDWWSAARQLPRLVTERGLASPQSLEQASAGGAAVGTGAAAKMIAFCIAAGGTAAICVSGVHDLQHPQHPQRRPSLARERVVEPDRARAAVIRSLPNRATIATTKRAGSGSRETAVSSRRSTPPPSPAPRGSTEFGPGVIGSRPAPAQPAGAPANGGGEFGP